MKENKINLNKAMPKDRLEKQSLGSRFIEFFILVSTACIIMYYLFKMLFGSPAQFKKDSDTLISIKNGVDSIQVMQDFNYQNLNGLRNEQAELRELIITHNNVIEENSREISNLKKVVNQKINTANQTINTQNKRIIELEQKNYNGLDSFFRSRQPKNR
jgi:hypothetical protein